MHIFDTSVDMAAGERGQIMMDRWLGHVAGKRSVIEMMPAKKNDGLTVFCLRWVAFLPTSCSRSAQTSSHTSVPSPCTKMYSNITM